ncbi:MAG: hypothetical protein HY587_08755 [Candidatus Omnitrophica bacterium]|nr:hypothetical protein [Candidatus Omnitrophota bacterium]
MKSTVIILALLFLGIASFELSPAPFKTDIGMFDSQAQGEQHRFNDYQRKSVFVHGNPYLKFIGNAKGVRIVDLSPTAQQFMTANIKSLVMRLMLGAVIPNHGSVEMITKFMRQLRKTAV